MTDVELIGSCGLYCRACPRYRASMADGRYVLEVHQASDYEAFHCLGCHSQKRSEFCQSCQIRLCAKAKDYHHCGLCPKFPCADLDVFAAEGYRYAGARHRREVIDNLKRVSQIGEDKWLEEQAVRWRCVCGFIYSGYEVTCHQCGQPLNSYLSEPG